MSDLTSFLATVGVVQGLDPQSVRALAGVCRERHLRAGTRLLRQGEANDTLYMLRTGRLAVRTRRGGERQTLAHLEPPAVVGEVSFATGRTCSADIDVVADADVVGLPLPALNGLPGPRRHVLAGLAAVVAERLHATLTAGPGARRRDVVRVRAGAGWAPRTFAEALAAALHRETAADVLLARDDGARPAEPTHVRDGVLETASADPLAPWWDRFDTVVVAGGPAPGGEDRGPAATHHVWLLGPHERVPVEAAPDHFVVQDAAGPAIPRLSARWRLARPDAAGTSAPAADAVARGIAGRQVGLALGGGGAWGWAHVGVLDVLERAGIPVDAIAGCSMGCVVGGLRASGASVAELRQVADYWKRNHRRWSELRFWRFHVANERRLTRAFEHLFGDRRLERFETPFQANAIDIETGEEVAIADGRLVDAVRASMAFPGWTPPVRRGGRWLVDAAFIDPVPTTIVRAMGCDRVIAVNTLGAMTARPLETRLPRQAYDVWDRYVRMAAHEIGRVHGEMAADLVISPPVGDTTMLSFGRGAELIEAGRRAADDRLPQLLDLVAPPSRR
jgi:predicted acylesterase/phospholipase RssA/CRP-like cAMP-binding protein